MDFIKEIFSMERGMAEGNLYGIMDNILMESGLTAKRVVKESGNLQMAITIRANGDKIVKMAKVIIFIPLVPHTKDSSKAFSSMETALNNS